MHTNCNDNHLQRIGMRNTTGIEVNEFDMNEKEALKAAVQELSFMENHADDLRGMLAVARDLIGQMATSAYQREAKQAERPKMKSVVKSIIGSFPNLSAEQYRVINKSVEFHFAAVEFNNLSPTLEPSWRDDHALVQLENMSFVNIVNRYY